ncbi:hypothetical protein LCGC14_0839580 [marine sediment metagenome]|uniref:Uncharacterized protein n=1 Tax=marine sediment metagenome TaxID=412755 RepID=A0A0F9PDK6_9ZZZZ
MSIDATETQPTDTEGASVEAEVSQTDFIDEEDSLLTPPDETPESEQTPKQTWGRRLAALEKELLATLGDITDLLRDESNHLEDVPGLGPAKVDTIKRYLDAYWKAHPEHSQDAADEG